MGRARHLALLSLAVASITMPAQAEDPPLTLVLPLRSVGVSQTTAMVVGNLLRGELESRGVALVPASRIPNDLPQDDAACDNAECATVAATAAGASRVVYGSLSQLGGKVILRIRALSIGKAAPDYADQIAANSEEDLDTVVRRVAETLAAGRTNADRASVDTVTDEETLEPRRRASRSRFGLRAGFLFPDGSSYFDTDRMTSLGLVIHYETPGFLIKSTPLLSFAWRGDTVEWTPFDLFFARIFGLGDFAPYVGGGLGITIVHLQRGYVYPADPYYESGSQSETTLVADLGAGILALRTYDFAIDIDLRYHYVFADFDHVGGKGAHGFGLRFGIVR